MSLVEGESELLQAPLHAYMDHEEQTQESSKARTIDVLLGKLYLRVITRTL